MEQLEHPVERGQRRAQLVRRGRDERPARLLLLLQALLHLVEGPGQVAHLVAAAVGGHGDRRPVGGELERRVAQAAQAADDRGRQRDAEQERQGQPGQRGVQERRADGGHGGVHGVQRLAHDQDPVLGSAARTDVVKGRAARAYCVSPIVPML